MNTTLAAPDRRDVRVDFSALRVLVVHEWLYAWAGAERVLEQILAVFPQADLLVGTITQRMRDHNAITRRARESWVGRIPGARAKHRWFLPMHAAAFATYDTSGYDLVISASHAFEKFIRRREGAVHVCYCHSPPRFLWGLQDVYGRHSGLATRWALRLAAPILRDLDRRAAAGVDHFVCNSRYVAERIRRAYGRESDVVYPPVATPHATVAATRSEPYLLFVGRLVAYKRTDLAIHAARRLGMRLVIVGDGPERPKLERLADARTEFRGELTDPEVAGLLRGCAAFVFAGEEDFGISLVEANAHGRPVVCFAAGGALESMIPNVTATFFERQRVEDVTDAIARCLDTRWEESRLRENAARFAPERFREGFRHAVARQLQESR